MAGPFEGLGRSADPAYNRLTRYLASHWDEQQRVMLLGQKDTGTGTDVALRVLASRATMYVQVHVQHDGASGGGATYNTSTYVSSDRRDVREDRQLDETISRNGTDRYYVWLIPVFENHDGSFTKYDGADADDHMAFADLGT